MVIVIIFIFKENLRKINVIFAPKEWVSIDQKLTENKNQGEKII